MAASGARAEQRWGTGDTVTESEEGRCHGGSAAEEGTWYHLRKQPSIGKLQAKKSLASISRSQGVFAPGQMPMEGGREMLFLQVFNMPWGTGLWLGTGLLP